MVLVQNTLTPGPDAQALVAGGSVVVLVALSGRGADAEGPRSGNWMSNTRAWLVGRNLPAMHAAEINAAVTVVTGRADVEPSRVTARASGVAGVALLLAAAVNPQIGSVSLDRTPYSVHAAIDSPIHTNLHDAVIPGFAVKWDLADLRDLIAAAYSRVEGSDRLDAQRRRARRTLHLYAQRSERVSLTRSTAESRVAHLRIDKA